ncbi:translation initiation factor IF-2-like [Apodemus sylvaticus]|uniref:translation initiation factor IF-2-like n=1 Tax=Apodemus sylvaticus TaxID=10129 RepID=UPI002244D3C4|nr:translation initiation factor IF-2-like [Apodemus sylvaticus]
MREGEQKRKGKPLLFEKTTVTANQDCHKAREEAAVANQIRMWTQLRGGDPGLAGQMQAGRPPPRRANPLQPPLVLRSGGDPVAVSSGCRLRKAEPMLLRKRLSLWDKPLPQPAAPRIPRRPVSPVPQPHTLPQRRARQLRPVLGEGVAEALAQAAQVREAAVQVEHAAVRPLGADLEELLLIATPADDEPADPVHPAAAHEHVHERCALKHRRGHAAGGACPCRRGRPRPPAWGPPGQSGVRAGAIRGSPWDAVDLPQRQLRVPVGRSWCPAMCPSSARTLGRLRAARAQGGAARSLSDCTGCGFIRHFPSRAARASTSSPGCGASLLPPADPPRAVPARSSTHSAASSVCGLLGGAGPALSRRAGRLSSRSYSISSGFSNPELSTQLGPHGGGIDTSLESRVPGRCRTGRGTRAPTKRESGTVGLVQDPAPPSIGPDWAGTRAGPPRVPSVTGVSAPGPPAHSGRALA